MKAAFCLLLLISLAYACQPINKLDDKMGSDDTTPASTENTTPASIENTTPASAENTTPASAENTTPASIENTTPASAENTTPASGSSTPGNGQSLEEKIAAAKSAQEKAQEKFTDANMIFNMLTKELNDGKNENDQDKQNLDAVIKKKDAFRAKSDHDAAVAEEDEAKTEKTKADGELKAAEMAQTDIDGNPASTAEQKMAAKYAFLKAQTKLDKAAEKLALAMKRTEQKKEELDKFKDVALGETDTAESLMELKEELEAIIQSYEDKKKELVSAQKVKETRDAELKEATTKLENLEKELQQQQ
ncbi:hypothetical protein QR680_014690 [Steinernema hermaphroditum]|uniref:Uncharacterized protein n=1 Tax=Steinernema hermaphroditum TaxID=289476 RepID=A0AA39M4I5_9BILA|nr:hypothetical protein QR680_014690 [Steinernema hermaphroditum]